MTGDELRSLIRASGLTQRALAEAMSVSQAGVGYMAKRAKVGKVNAQAIRYIVANGPEEQLLTIPEVLRAWRSQKQLAWYSGISLSTLYRIFTTGKLTPRMSMAIRQASVDRERDRQRAAAAQ